MEEFLIFNITFTELSPPSPLTKIYMGSNVIFCSPPSLHF